MCRVSGPGHLRLEPGVFVRAVVDSPRVAVRLQQAVVSGDSITHAFLSLFLDVVGMLVSYTVLEFVISGCLQHKNNLKKKKCFGVENVTTAPECIEYRNTEVVQMSMKN